MRINTKQLTAMSMMSALAYVVMLIFHFVPIPIVAVSFLQYDPKDIIIAIGGFIWGPLSAFCISVIVSVLEMITVSDTDFIGCIMNIISTCAFACTASAIYKIHRSLTSAVIGLVTACIAMTSIMMLWNYLITPLYMKVPRETVVAMLLPAFLPFNLLKSVLNAGFTFLLYKPIISTLRKAGLVEPSSNKESKKATGYIILAGMVIITCILIILVMRGVI